jgi:hypothetical protein
VRRHPIAIDGYGCPRATAEVEDALLVAPLEELHLGPENAPRAAPRESWPRRRLSGARRNPARSTRVAMIVALGQPAAEEQEEEDWLEHARQVERRKKRQDKKKMQQRDDL